MKYLTLIAFSVLIVLPSFAQEEINGCTYSQACNYAPDALEDDGSCIFAEFGYDCEGNCLIDTNNNGICDFEEVYGCTYVNALNFNPEATTDDFTCSFTCAGDFDNNAVVDAADLLTFLVAYGNSCGEIGCTNPEAINYDPEADLDNGSCIFYGQMADIEGNTYNTVIIGEQEWMAENLRTRAYANGDPITNGQESSVWFALTTGGYTIYNDDPALEEVYGLLYNWAATQDERNVCPTGWHVPTDPEWTVLTDNLGGEGVAGEKLKATGTEFWQEPNFAANNESGFSALPGGWRLGFGPFNFNGQNSYFWTETTLTASNKWYRRMSYDTGIVSRDFSDPKLGMSIRCVRD